LRGTPIIRHTETFGMVFDAHPPYTILATDRIDFLAMQRLVRFARYWDLIANSGRFTHTLPLIVGDTPFKNFMALSDWLYKNTDATHRIALERLAALVVEWMLARGADAEAVAAAMDRDYAGQTGKAPARSKATKKAAAPARQVRHLVA
jgi:hypothetical protein